ncbi:MAG TPA: hypothetical protein VHM90_08805 [Phycisphaerae bacterium]|nr:hypothetical protein [Phycisphaerae bacterium]
MSKRLVALSLIVGAMVCGSCALPGQSTGVMGARAPGLPLDEGGYIRHWLVLGPIYLGENTDSQQIDLEQIPGEGKLMPVDGAVQTAYTTESDGQTSKQVEAKLTWYRVDTKEYYFDLNAALDMENSDNCVGYAVAYLDAAREMGDITFSLCSNDSGKIFLNGKEIYRFSGSRSTEEDVDAVAGLALHKGINVIVFKVLNMTNNWTGNIRVVGRDGIPPPGVTVKVPK